MNNNFKPYELIDGDRSQGLILVCDHARNSMPAEYDSLGLPASELNRHIAYDIGAEGLTRGLAKTLGVPAIMATFSRLLIDPNRGENDPTLIRQLYDGTIIPGNYPITPNERAARLQNFYHPYHSAIEKLIRSCLTRDIIPSVLAVHSMTDEWNGIKRPWQLSVLWDSDPRFAGPLLEQIRSVPGLTVGENEPYDGALQGDTLHRHCTSAGLSHALLEIRQDLVSDQQGINKWVEFLAPKIERVNALPHNRVILKYGSRSS